MKQVYPQVRPRRLGTRGNSRYCYAGLKKRLKLEEPVTPECGGENGAKNLVKGNKISNNLGLFVKHQVITKNVIKILLLKAFFFLFWNKT